MAPPEILRGVVDDHRTNRQILEGMLGRWQMKTTSAEDGPEALQLSAARDAKEPFGLILTDMHMPKMDGFTLIEHIRERPELATATIMSLRRRATGETPRAAWNSGWQPICLN